MTLLKSFVKLTPYDMVGVSLGVMLSGSVVLATDEQMLLLS
jgi:hypothetical protein